MSSSKLLAGPLNHLRQCRHGFMLYNTNDVLIGRSLDVYGEFSEGETDAFRQLLRPGNIVVDVGANIGTHTLFFAQAVGRGGLVYAFEPQRIVFQTLCANLALNSITNVFCYQAALGEAPGTVLVPPLDYAQPNNYGSLELGTHTAGERVSVWRLDDLELPSCRLIKVDVEGMELQVLRGAAGMIGRHQPILYVENDRPHNSLELERYIESLGYEMYWHLPALFNPNNYDRNPENIFDNLISGNLLCVHPASDTRVSGLPRAVPGQPAPFSYS
jgi:FkbM family methyltransferase